MEDQRILINEKSKNAARLMPACKTLLEVTFARPLGTPAKGN